MKQKLIIAILKKVIILLRENGVKMDSPYDFENWIEDNASHSNLFETKEFERDEEN
jgi:hypothetical protein